MVGMVGMAGMAGGMAEWRNGRKNGRMAEIG
jgi:hypothetical protein